MRIPEIYISEVYITSRVETHQADSTGNGGRKRAEDVHGWAQPLGQPLIPTVRFIKVSDLILKDGDYGGSRVAILQLRSKRVGEKILLGLLLVGLQGSLEDSLEG